MSWQGHWAGNSVGRWFGYTSEAPVSGVGGGFTFYNRLKTKRRKQKDAEKILSEIADRFQAERLRHDPKSIGSYEEEVSYELDLNGITQSEIDAEIARLLHKKLRTEEDEIILLLIMAAAIA